MPIPAPLNGLLEAALLPSHPRQSTLPPPLILFPRFFSGRPDGHHHHLLRRSTEARTWRGWSGVGRFRAVGSVIGLVAHYRSISAGLAFYGAGWSAYSRCRSRD
jgi:hypothetical protein